MRIFNRAVKMYLLRYKKTIADIRKYSLYLQDIELRKILNTPYFAPLDHKSFTGLAPSFYSDYQKDILQKINKGTGLYQGIKTFAKSADTSMTGAKYIPTSQLFLLRNHVNAGWLTMSIMYALKSDMDIISKKNLLVGGAIYKSETDLTIADISGLMIRNIPRIFHSYYVPSIEEATMPDWEEKLQVTAKKAAVNDIVMLAGVPTWILTLATEVLKYSGKNNLSEVWPYLKVYLHGGVKFDPYKAQFKELLPTSNVLYLEVYNASEGFFAIQDTLVNHGLLLLTCHGIYYEFILFENYKKADYYIINLAKVVPNMEYVMLITTLSGLRRYVVGDTIIFTTILPFRIKVKGRISEYINAFGEDLTQEAANRAITETLLKHNAHIRNYTVAPKYISLYEKGSHEWYIEFERSPCNIDIFKKELDLCIQNYNFNYKQKRTNDLAITELDIIELPKGFFNRFAKKRKKFGGQNKLPKLNNDRKLISEIEKLLKIEDKNLRQNESRMAQRSTS